MGGCNRCDVFCVAVSFVKGEEDSRLCFCFFMLRKKRGGNVYGIYAMAASGRMQYDYKHTNKLHACIANACMTVLPSTPQQSSAALSKRYQ